MLKMLFEGLFAASLFVNALLFVPQCVKIYQIKSAQAFSLLTFGGFLILQSLTIIHALLHKDWILFIGYVISFVVCAILVFMIIYYNRLNKNNK